jgi:hypothetical protein
MKGFQIAVIIDDKGCTQVKAGTINDQPLSTVELVGALDLIVEHAVAHRTEVVLKFVPADKKPAANLSM